MSASGTTAPAKSQSNDASQLKLGLSPEALYISNTIESCISNVEIVATLPAILQFHNLSGVVDEDLSRIIQEHHIISENLEKLEGLKQESERDQRGEAEEASRREGARLEGNIKSSVRKALRFFRANPNAFVSLRAELDADVGENESILIRALKTSYSHMIKMLTSLDEEPRLSSTSDQRMEELVSLEETVATALKEMDEKVKPHREEELVSLEETVATTLKEMEEKFSHYESEIKDHQSYLNNTEEEDLSLHPDKPDQKTVETSTKLISLQQQTDELRKQLKSSILENRQVERIIQEKNEILRKEIESLIQVFDDKMEETQTKLELIESEYTSDQEAVKELEKMFPALEVKYNKILEKQRLAEEKMREEMKELELKTRAAIIAQSWWRGYSTRMALKNKGKGKKTKKGKGRKSK